MTIAAHRFVRDVMHAPVVSIAAQSTLRGAARTMRDADVGALAIVERGEVVGLISERDVTWALADGADPDVVWVADVMSENPRYATEHETVSSVGDSMLAVGVRHLPVIEDCQLVGVVSIRDVLHELQR